MKKSYYLVEVVYYSNELNHKRELRLYAYGIDDLKKEVKRTMGDHVFSITKIYTLIEYLGL